MKTLTQQQIIIELLQENESVNSYDLTYKHSIKQAPTRVHELREKGFQIVSSATLKDGSINYFLLKGSSGQLSKATPLKIEPEGANLASNKKNPNKGRVIAYYDNLGNRGVITL